MPSSLSHYELQLLADRDFLLTKQVIDVKITERLLAYEQELVPFFKRWASFLPKSATLLPNKVNKGQNYGGLPYWVVDFPSVFEGKDIFTYRVVVWWGNHISLNLILQGRFFKNHRLNIDQLLDSNVHYCVHNSPWRLEFEPKNLIAVNSMNLITIKAHQKNCQFLKLSSQYPLDSLDKLTVLSQANFEKLFSVVNWLNI